MSDFKVTFWHWPADWNSSMTLSIHVICVFMDFCILNVIIIGGYISYLDQPLLFSCLKGNIKCCGCLPRFEHLSCTFFFNFLQKQNVKTSLVLHFCNLEGPRIQTSANRGKYSHTFVACFKVMFLVSIEILLILGWVELQVIFIVQLCCVLIGQSMSLV